MAGLLLLHMVVPISARSKSGFEDGLQRDRTAVICQSDSTESESADIVETGAAETIAEMHSPQAVAWQERVDALPSPEAYDYLSLREKRSALREARDCRDIYYQELSVKDRQDVDPAGLFALDIYGVSYAYYATEEEYSGQLTLDDVKTMEQSSSDLKELEKDMANLPSLGEIVELSDSRGRSVSYSEDEGNMSISQDEVDALYPKVFSAAEDYYTLPQEQAALVDSENLPVLTAFFSVGVATYAASDSIGSIVAYDSQRYDGDVSDSHLRYGYYEVSTEQSQGERVAFCMDSLAATPGGVGTKLYSEAACTSKEIRTILYYGYGGPGELVPHNRNGYCETHMAICYALDGKASNNGFASAAYDKLYTNVKDKDVYSYVKAWTVQTGVSGTQPLVYAIFCGDASLKKVNALDTTQVIAGAKYQVYTDADCKQAATTVDGKNALLISTKTGSNMLKLPAGTYYVKEVEAPEGFIRDDSVHTLKVRKGQTKEVVVKDEPYGMLVVAKRGAATKDVLANAVYRVYAEPECRTLYKDIYGTGSMTTIAEEGWSNVLYYPAGARVYIREYAAPEGTLKNPTIYTTVIQAGRYNYPDGQSSANLRKRNAGWVEDEEFGKVSIYKVDAVTGEVVAGARYQLFVDEDCLIPAKTVKGNLAVFTTTNAGSNTRQMALNVTYYAKEISAPEGYQKNNEVIPVVTTKRGETYVIHTEDQPGGGTPEKGRIPLELYKLDAEMKESKEGDALSKGPFADSADQSALSGAIFALECEIMQDTESYSEEHRTWYFRTDEEGYLRIDDESCLVDVFCDSEQDDGQMLTSDSLMKDEEGHVVFPLGNYRIREVVPPTGYTMEGSMEFAFHREGLLQEWPTASVTEGLTFELCDDPVTGMPVILVENVAMDGERICVKAYDRKRVCRLSLVKRGRNGQSLAGVSYQLKRSAGAEINLSGEAVVYTGTTDSKGEVTWENLEPGDYILTETATVDGYSLLAEPIQVTLPLCMTPEEAEAAGADLSRACYDEASGCYYFDTLYLDITDSVQFQIPMAGKEAGIFDLLAILAWFMMGVGAFVIKKAGTRFT